MDACEQREDQLAPGAHPRRPVRKFSGDERRLGPLARALLGVRPLPIWVCEETGYTEAVGSYAELLAKPGVTGAEVWENAKREQPDLPDDLKVHKPYIDAITYDSPKAPGARMRRVSEVIDCWFDSGAMPFAQWGYPHQPGSRERIRDQFPADFISEALDQTRGWFYSLLAISTLLFSPEQEEPSPSTPPQPYPHPFRNCIVLGLMLGEDGQKMSKSKRNYREPTEIFDRYGADALRWYFFSNQPPWTSIRYSEKAIRETIPEFLLKLWNVYSFLVIYANIDGFDPAAGLAGPVGQLGPDVLGRAEGYRSPAERGELDRWILSELNRTALAVVERMDGYDNYTACQRLTEFLDALSNWYVRRSRDRFWTGAASSDKTDAYWTLYECMLTTAKLIAPFVPFVAEAVWQNLAVEPFGQRVVESVHLCDYPAGDPAAIDTALSERMAMVREIVSLGRAARMDAKLKVRQPLARVEVVLADAEHQAWLEDHAGLVREELNVKQVEYIQHAEQYINYTVLPDLKRLGPRLGKRLPPAAPGPGQGRRGPAPRGAGVARASGVPARRRLRDPGARRPPGSPGGQARLERGPGPGRASSCSRPSSATSSCKRAWPANWSTPSRACARTRTTSTPTGSASAWRPSRPSCSRPSKPLPITSAARRWPRNSRSAVCPAWNPSPRTSPGTRHDCTSASCNIATRWSREARQ